MKKQREKLSLKKKLKKDLHLSGRTFFKFLTIVAVIIGIVIGIHEFLNISYFLSWILIVVMVVYFLFLVIIISIGGWAGLKIKEKVNELIFTYKNAKKYEQENKRLKKRIKSLERELRKLKLYERRVKKLRRIFEHGPLHRLR